jgi:glycosyltransferase involved in cell wall biosynthesis
MKAWLNRLRVIGEDWLRYHPFLRNRLADWRRWRDRWHTPRHHQERARAIHSLCAAARLSNRGGTVERICARIQEHVRCWTEGRSEQDGGASAKPQAAWARLVDWREFVSDLSPALGMSELIKAPGELGEKGVLFLPFESEWVRLMVHADLKELARRYHLVLAPSSSPPYNLINFVFSAAFPAPLFTLVSNRQDIPALPRICPRFVVVPLFASSWVDPERFSPLAREQRDIDLIMVANFAKFKRHHALFRALRRMPRSLRVLLIGQDNDGRTADTIRTLADHFGVGDRFTLLADATYGMVVRSLCRARASVILSKREGSCVVIAESLFADTPAALLRGAEIGSSAFINEQTGRFLDESELAEQLTEFIAQSDRYHARAWAESNISCWQSVRVLNETIKQHALAASERWTADIRPFTWCPFPRLLHPADREALAPARREFHERFGLNIGPPEPCRVAPVVELTAQTPGV